MDVSDNSDSTLVMNVIAKLPILLLLINFSEDSASLGTFVCWLWCWKWISCRIFPKNKQTNKQKKAVSLHEAYKSPVHKKLKEGEAI